MSKFKFIYFLLPVMLVMVLLTSCRRDDDDDDDQPIPPSLNVQENRITAEPGDTVRYQITAGTNSVLSTVRITSSTGTGGATVMELDSTLTGTIRSFNYVHRQPVPETAAIGSSIKLVFTVTDKEGLTTTTEKTIHVAEGYELFTDANGAPFRIYNILGNPAQAAYSLDDLTPRADQDPDSAKTIKDQTDVLAQFARSWSSGTGNGSRLVKARSTFNFENANTYTVHQEYLAGNPSSEVSNLLLNNVVIINNRGTGEYIIVKIVDVKITGDGYDYIEFHLLK